MFLVSCQAKRKTRNREEKKKRNEGEDELVIQFFKEFNLKL
jgi:hypothetical protein